MCFTNPTTTRAINAKKDIKVYKRIQKDGWGWMWNLFINGKEEPWTIGFHYTESNFPMVFSRTIMNRVEGDAFHSVKSKTCSAWDKINCNEDDKTAIMIIPKGSYYYENKEGFIVSSDIIYLKDE